MGELVTLFPIRQAPTLAEVVSPAEHELRWARNAAQAAAFSSSPRGRFLDAVQRLSEHYEHTADRLIQAYRAGFGAEARCPSLDHLGQAFADLASIPRADAYAHRQARIACAALVEIAGFTDQSQPNGGAA